MIFFLACHLLLSSCDPSLRTDLNHSHALAVLFKHILVKVPDSDLANSKLSRLLRLVEDIKHCTNILENASFIQATEPENLDVDLIQVQEL